MFSSSLSFWPWEPVSEFKHIIKCISGISYKFSKTKHIPKGWGRIVKQNAMQALYGIHKYNFCLQILSSKLSCTWVQQIAGTAHVSSFTMSLFSIPNKLSNACFCIFIILSKRQKGKNEKWKKLLLVHKLQHTKALHARAHTLLSGLVSLSCSQSFIIGTRMRAGYGDSFHTHSHRIRSNPDGIFSYWKLFCLFYFFFSFFSGRICLIVWVVVCMYCL